MVDIRLSSVRVESASTARQNIRLSSVRVVSSSPTALEPFQRVNLPAGTWSYTSGPPVTIEGGRSFTTPALVDVSTPQVISLRAAGTPTGVTTLANVINPSVPAAALPGDLSVLTVTCKPYWATITTPTGWTKIGETTNGSTGTGDDTGSVKVAVYVKESATPGPIGNIGQATANVMAAVIDTYAQAAGTGWDITAFTAGSDASNGANYSATGAAGIDVSVGDRVIAATGINSDAGTLSAITVGGMSGATISDSQTRANAAITTGNDLRLLVQDVAVSAGSSSAAPTLTFTNASSSSGATIWFRIRGNPSTGGVLTLTEAGGATQQFQIRPHTFFLLRGGEWTGAEMVVNSDTWGDYPSPTPVIEKPEFGTLQTVFNSEEYAGGVRWAMLEVNWRDWETVNGTLLASYTSTVLAKLAAYKAAGFKVALGLGLHYKPTWYAGLAASTPSMYMKNQYGDVATGFSNLVFSQAARNEAEQYLTLVDAALGLENFDSIRIASGSKNGEVLYPESTGTTYKYNWWIFDAAAQGGADLAAGMVATPWPGWVPGATKPGGATNVGPLLDFAIDALVRTVKWEEDFLISLGFTGDFDLLFAGRGVTPSVWAAMHTDANLLTNNTAAVGAVWQTIAAAVPYRSRTALQCTSVAENTSTAYPTLTDRDVPVTSTAANGWTAARWVKRLADEYGMKTKGENPGFGLGAVDADYKDTSSNGLMARFFETVTQPGMEFDVAWWAHSGPLHPTNGGATPAIVPFSAYAARIAAFRSGQTTPPFDPNAMPTGNLPGWTYLRGEDFLTDFPVGGYRTAMGIDWDRYHNATDSSDDGTYRLDLTASAQNSWLKMHMHKVAGQPTAWVSAPTPWNGAAQKYGRYSWRWYTTGNSIGNEFKVAWLLWPDESSGTPNPGPPHYWWALGEIDFNEGSLTNLGAYSHRVNYPAGPPSDNIMYWESSVSARVPHIGVCEWTPTRVTILNDGVKVAETTNLAGIPQVPMRLVLQSETNFAPATDGSQADVFLDWFCMWAYTP